MFKSSFPEESGVCVQLCPDKNPWKNFKECLNRINTANSTLLWRNTAHGKLYLIFSLLGGILPNTASEDLTKAYQILDVEKDLGNFSTSKLHRLLIAAFINYITVCLLSPQSHLAVFFHTPSLPVTFLFLCFTTVKHDFLHRIWD